MEKQLIMLELNEINFGFVEHYVSKGKLPTLGHLLEKHGYSQTTSEQEYEELEPWIQWVTAHTGLSYSDHGVFRLGDVRGRGLLQIWEELEKERISVGAISPMNAENKLTDPAFFIPDPWTDTPSSRHFLFQAISDAVSQAVNDNAQSQLSPRSALSLAAGLVTYGRRRSLQPYLKYVLNATKKPWAKALFLDRFLADMFLSSLRRSKPRFSSLFLNAGAHIQHHYMFSSAAYQGQRKNPTWYVPTNQDPLLEVYELYDSVVKDVLATAPQARIFLATGLHQDPHEDLTYYWRLSDHRRFLGRLGVSFEDIEPRMSRDFLVKCSSTRQAADAQNTLEGVRHRETSERIFDVDNRGQDLFVTLTYRYDIGPHFFVESAGRSFRFDTEVAFVAIKNGKHNGIGYFLDTASTKGAEQTFPLTEVSSRIREHFGLARTRSISEELHRPPSANPIRMEEAVGEQG